MLTSIKQASYSTGNDPDSKQETDLNGRVYNTITRHAFLPSVSEIGKVVDLKNLDKVKAFSKGEYVVFCTRDSYQCNDHEVELLSSYRGSLFDDTMLDPFDIHPAFVIDLSGVNYSVVK